MRKIINDLHLYKNKMEMIIKVLAWGISWIGGIVAVLNVQEKNPLNSAYFIFALSLLIEFAPMIKEKQEFISRIAHTLFCGLMLVLLFMATVPLIANKTLESKYYNVMFGITVAILVYMVVDLIVLWVSPENIDFVPNASVINTEDLEDYKEDNRNLACKEEFQNKLRGGNLGDIGKELRDE